MNSHVLERIYSQKDKSEYTCKAYTNYARLLIYTLEQVDDDHRITPIASCLKAWSSHRKMWKDNLSKIIYIFILSKVCASVLGRSSTLQNSLSFAQKGGVPGFFTAVYTHD